MSRKQKLRETLNQYLAYDNHGNFNKRQDRQFVLNKIIENFFETRFVPAHWHAIKKEHVQTLVNFWKKRGLMDSTIMNYLVHLRYFLKMIEHNVEGIDNQSLKLRKSRSIAKPLIDGNATLQSINDPIAYVLFALQIKFGLTLHEAMHIAPAIHIHHSELWITRELSINHKDRFIPIITLEQGEIVTKLNQLCGKRKNLMQQFGEKHLRLAWQYSLKLLGLPTNLSYNHLYAKSRFFDLCRQYDKKESKTIVLNEMSINESNSIWRTINEQYQA